MSTLISRLYNWVTDKTNVVKITASRQDAELDQMIIALNRKELCAASAPDSPIAGQTWVDTTNKLRKCYLDNEWKTYSDDTTLIGKIYPIGSIYIGVTSTNPGTLFGVGTWTAFGAGKVLVGLDAGDADFDAAEETGGAKTVTLTAAQSGVPAHTHTAGGLTRGSAAGGSDPNAVSSSGGSGYAPASAANATAAASSAHANVQPYIVVYMWKRTA